MMKLIHLSDLHLGKRISDYSMIEDQEYILKEIIKIVDTEKPDGIILAGDIYDKPVPSAEAVELFDSFLVRLAKRKLAVFIISGNHDSPERIAFGGRIMKDSRIFLSPVYEGKTEPIELMDGYGSVRFYLLPFIKPVHVRRYHPEDEITSYTDAIRTAIKDMEIDPGVRNVLVTHQFVTGASRSDSEEISVGGSENVDASVLEPFDYVALGHLHSPQNCGSEWIRYCGTPLKYSFSEVNDHKSVTIVELGKKESIRIRTVPLKPRRDWADLRGTYEELTLRSFYESTTYRDDYVRITLTDEEDIMDAIGKLRMIYHNLMNLNYDNTRTRMSKEIEKAEEIEHKTPLELFGDFYALQNNQKMSEEQEQYMTDLIEKMTEGER